MCKMSHSLTSKIRNKRLTQLLKKRFKVYLDLDMVFYRINYGKLNANLVYKENEFYDNTIEGIPAYLKLQIGDSNEYLYYPDLEPSKLKKGQEYAIICYKTAGAFSNPTIALVFSMELYSIKVRKNKR